MSTFVDMKKKYEKAFQDTWTETPIHFSGQEFKSTNVPKWVSPYLTPVSGENVGFNDMMRQYANLYVSCWADVDLDAMALADLMTPFIKSLNTDTIRVRGYEVADHSYHPSNKVVVIMSYRIEYVSEC